MEALIFIHQRVALSCSQLLNWLTFRLIQAFMVVLHAIIKKIHSKTKSLEYSQHFFHCKTVGTFEDAQRQLTQQYEVGSGLNSSLSMFLWLSLLAQGSL